MELVGPVSARLGEGEKKHEVPGVSGDPIKAKKKTWGQCPKYRGHDPIFETPGRTAGGGGVSGAVTLSVDQRTQSSGDFFLLPNIKGS